MRVLGCAARGPLVAVALGGDACRIVVRDTRVSPARAVSTDVCIALGAAYTPTESVALEWHPQRLLLAVVQGSRVGAVNVELGLFIDVADSAVCARWAPASAVLAGDAVIVAVTVAGTRNADAHRATGMLCAWSVRGSAAVATCSVGDTAPVRRRSLAPAETAVDALLFMPDGRTAMHVRMDTPGVLHVTAWAGVLATGAVVPADRRALVLPPCVAGSLRAVGLAPGADDLVAVGADGGVAVMSRMDGHVRHERVGSLAPAAVLAFDDRDAVTCILHTADDTFNGTATLISPQDEQCRQSFALGNLFAAAPIVRVNAEVVGGAACLSKSVSGAPGVVAVCALSDGGLSTARSDADRCTQPRGPEHMAHLARILADVGTDASATDVAQIAAAAVRLAPGAAPGERALVARVLVPVLRDIAGDRSSPSSQLCRDLVGRLLSAADAAGRLDSELSVADRTVPLDAVTGHRVDPREHSACPQCCALFAPSDEWWAAFCAQRCPQCGAERLIAAL